SDVYAARRWPDASFILLPICGSHGVRCARDKPHSPFLCWPMPPLFRFLPRNSRLPLCCSTVCWTNSTVARGRQQLLDQKVTPGRTRHPGGGRKPVEKKTPTSSP